MWARVVGVLLAVLLDAAGAAAATHTLRVADAIALARLQSPEGRRIALEARRDLQRAAASRAASAPGLTLAAVAPRLAREFSVGLQPARGDSVRSEYVETTTTSHNGSADLQASQLLPWRGRLSALASMFYRDEATAPLGLRAARRDYQVAASLGLEMPLWGADDEHDALRRAHLSWDQASSRARTARARLEFETVTHYLDVVRARAALDIARATVERAAEAAAVAQRKVQAGLLPEVEALRTEVVRAEREAQAAGVESQLARTDDEFKTFLGIPPQDSLQLVEPLAPVAAPDSAAPWVARALSARDEPGLAARDAELLDRERRGHRPYTPDVDLALRYGGGANQPDFDRALSSLSANSLSLALTLRMTLSDGGRASDLDHAAIADADLRRLDAEDARRRIELEVRDAVRQMQDAARRYRVLTASSRLAGELLRINSERYERGLIDTEAHLASQTDAAQARLGETGALLDLLQARARLRFVALEEHTP